jgi:small subunit ribosomal protein S27e
MLYGDLMMTRGEFLKLKCDECGNEQVVFSKPAEDVQCVVCDDVLAEARGGKAQLHAELVSTVS